MEKKREKKGEKKKTQKSMVLKVLASAMRTSSKVTKII